MEACWAKKPLSAERLMDCCRSSEERDAETMLDNGGLTCEVSERSKDSIETICVIVYIKNLEYLVGWI